jgi:hypothetical protein
VRLGDLLLGRGLANGRFVVHDQGVGEIDGNRMQYAGERESP